MGGGGRCLTALEADGARRLRNESFFSAPQLKRDPLGGTQPTMHEPPQPRELRPYKPSPLLLLGSVALIAATILNMLGSRSYWAPVSASIAVLSLVGEIIRKVRHRGASA